MEAPARLSGMVCHHCVLRPSVSRLSQNHDAAQPTPLATLVGVKTYQTTHVYARTASFSIPTKNKQTFLLFVKREQRLLHGIMAA